MITEGAAFESSFSCSSPERCTWVSLWSDIYYISFTYFSSINSAWLGNFCNSSWCLLLDKPSSAQHGLQVQQCLALWNNVAMSCFVFPKIHIPSVAKGRWSQSGVLLLSALGSWAPWWHLFAPSPFCNRAFGLFWAKLKLSVQSSIRWWSILCVIGPSGCFVTNSSASGGQCCSRSLHRLLENHKTLRYGFFLFFFLTSEHH